MPEKILPILVNELASPGAIYRGAPFWSWNGRLDPETIRAQIRNFKAMGLGGFFMHSRVGLATEYLGKQWFECVRAAVGEAEKLGMLAYLYDEDRWPSGAAGGLVTREEKFRQRRLKMIVYRDTANYRELPGEIRLFAAKINGSVAENIRVCRPDGTRDGESLLQFVVETMPPSPWYNGQTALDTLNPEAVARFIAVTHEKYFSEVGDKFGKIIPAIFTDEPSYTSYSDGVETAPGIREASCAWTPALPEFFRKRFGTELTDRLPEIFFNRAAGEFSLTRYRYFDCVCRLFVESFSRQIGQWCEQHHIALTGHLLEEDSLAAQTRTVGSAMRSYPHMQMPGIDQLCEDRDTFDTVKQLSSVARQFGRRWRVCETYGASGWDLPLRGHKAIGDWQAALGVNLRCQHLAWYTMSGEAKRDYPASISFQSNFAPYYPLVEDYFARVNLALSMGREVRDLLLVSPIESMWGTFTRITGAFDAETEKLEFGFPLISHELLKRTLDFDFGDEELMADHASADVSGGAAVLRVGEAEYRAVLLPPMRTIRRTTQELLKHFLSIGGRVALAGTPPTLVDGEPDPDALEFLAALPRGIDALEPHCRRVKFRDGGGNAPENLLIQLREADDALTLFVCNTSRPCLRTFQGWSANRLRCAERRVAWPELRVSVATDRRGEWCELIPETGELHPVPAVETASGYEFMTSFEALRSRIFLLTAPGALPTTQRHDFPVARREKTTAGKWRFTRDEANVLVLDHAEWRLNGGELHAEDYIINIDDAVRDGLGVAPRSGMMVQPWVDDGRHATPSGGVFLRYRFTVAERPAGTPALCVENPETMRIRLNGETLAATDTGFWIDPALRRLAFAPERLAVGENILELEVDYRCSGRGLEALYLCGEFGVDADDRLTAVPLELEPGDWCAAKFPYYAGNGTYSTTFQYSGSGRVALKLGEFEGAAVRVAVNGRTAGVLGWEPLRVELTPLLRTGSNDLDIEIIGSRRNAMGPFYHEEARPRWCGPGEFKCHEHRFRHLAPSGMLEAPELEFE